MGRAEPKNRSEARGETGRVRFPLVLSALLLVIGPPLEARRPGNEESASRETQIAAELAAKSKIVVPRLFETLATRLVRSESGEGEAEPLTIEGERVILKALELMDPELILSYVERELGATSIGRRRASVQFLGSAGRATEILRLIGVAYREGDEELDATISRATRQAVVSIIRRDPVTFGVLEGSLPALQVEVLPPIIEALGVVGDTRGFEFLCTAAREQEGLRLLVLEQIPAVGRSGKVLHDMEMRGYARELIRLNRPGCRTAIRAAATLHDDDAIPVLIDLLPEDPTLHEKVSREVETEASDLEVAASAALYSMTGMSFESKAGWIRWYEAERAWMVTERAAAFQKLSSSDPRQVAEALEAIAPHPLVREEFVSVLGDLLRTRSVEIRLMVCSAIQNAGAREAIPQLVSALSSEAGKVGVAALHALKSLTGRDLPLDVELWSAVARELGYDLVRVN